MTLLLFLTVSSAVPAQWQGPTAVLSLTEGSGPNQVGIGHEEVNLGEDAHNFCVDDDGNIVIADTLNNRILIFGSDGTGKKVIFCPQISGHCNFWPAIMVAHQTAHRILVSDELCVYDYDANIHKCFKDPFGPNGALYFYAVPNGFILQQFGSEWRDVPGKPGKKERYTIKDYWSVDLEGNLLGKLENRPLDLGLFTEENGHSYLKFPGVSIPADDIPGCLLCQLLPDGNVLIDGEDLYTSQGAKVATLEPPPNNFPDCEDCDYTYYMGPVTDTRGNIYYIKYTPGHYDILKWTYVGTGQCPTNAPSTLPGPQSGGQTAPKAAGKPKGEPVQGKKPPAPQASGEEAAKEKRPISWRHSTSFRWR